MTVKPNSKTVETIKTIVIVALLTGIVAFISGMKYQQHVNSQVKTEARSLVSMSKR